MMTTTRRPRKPRTQKPSPTPPSPMFDGDTVAVADTPTPHDPPVTTTPRRGAHPCPVCQTTHASIQSYLARHARRPYTKPDDVQWLRAHAAAAGIEADI